MVPFGGAAGWALRAVVAWCAQVQPCGVMDQPASTTWVRPVRAGGHLPWLAGLLVATVLAGFLVGP